MDNKKITIIMKTITEKLALYHYVNEKLTLNKQSKIIDNDVYLLCRPPLFNSWSTDFIEKYENRALTLWSNKMQDYMHVWVVTLNEVKDFWKKRTCECALYVLPEKLDINATEDDIQNFINDHDKESNDKWDPMNMEKYDSKNL